VLWDVDHTLIETRGVGTALYRRAFEEITGRPVEHPAEITGRTELAILADTLTSHGITPTPDQQRRYAAALALQYEGHTALLRERGRILPGAREALAALGREADILQSVLTGNLKAVAMTKLRVFGLDVYVDFEIGAYGDDDPERPKLVAIAQERAAATHGLPFDRTNTVLIGDSPHDVAAGRQGGAAVIAVASGSSTMADLQAAGADLVLPDLTNPAEVERAIRAAV